MARSKTSRKWLKEHFADVFVKKAQQEGYRSRAAYKLLEIQNKDKILKPGMTVVDLGAAPGGWTEVAASIVQPGGKVIAVDILPMDAVPDVVFIQGDFTDEETYNLLLQQVENKPVDVVISDMSPNISGIKVVDQAKSMYLAELALDFAKQVLKPGGVMLTKVFQGAGFEEYLGDLRAAFKQVKTRKPEASRSRSNEIYLLAKDFRGC